MAEKRPFIADGESDDEEVPSKGLKLLSKLNNHDTAKRLIVILVNASLETVKVCRCMLPIK